MKNYTLAIVLATIVWQPLCIGMFIKKTQPTLEGLLSTIAISNDICKITFKDTTKPVEHTVVTKYLLVKQIMKNNGFHFLSINMPSKINTPIVNLQVQSPFTQIIEREIMQSEPKNYNYFIIKRIANYDDAFSTLDVFQHLSLSNPYSMFRCRKLRTFDLHDKPRLQRLPITFQLPPLWMDESDRPERCGEEYELELKSEQKRKNAIDAAKNFVDKMKLHSDLPPIVALDTFISHATR